MLVGNEDRINIVDMFPGILQHFTDSLARESCINQYSAVLRLEERAVARAAGTKNPKIIPHYFSIVKTPFTFWKLFLVLCNIKIQGLHDHAFFHTARSFYF